MDKHKPQQESLPAIYRLLNITFPDLGLDTDSQIRKVYEAIIDNKGNLNESDISELYSLSGSRIIRRDWIRSKITSLNEKLEKKNIKFVYVGNAQKGEYQTFNVK